MKKIFSLLLFLLISSSLFYCKSKQMNKEEQENKITFQSKDVTKELYNQDKTLLLILKYKADGNLPTTFNYKVIDVKTKEKKKEGVFIGSKIEWQDNTSLKCFVHKGIIQKEDLLDSEKSNSNNNIIIEIHKP